MCFAEPRRSQLPGIGLGPHEFTARDRGRLWCFLVDRKQHRERKPVGVAETEGADGRGNTIEGKGAGV